MEVKQISANSGGETSGSLALPFNDKQFADFLVGLLGKPQTITKRIKGSFEIDKDTITGLHEILEQRIHQQNDASLLQLRATIVYNDSSTIDLSGFDHLVNFNEPLPLVVKAIHLTWQYLIKFKDKDLPEKQEITITFQVGSSMNFNFDPYEFIFSHQRNLTQISIAHTARTWGADIESLLTKHLNILCNPASRFASLQQNNPHVTQKIVYYLLLIISISCSYLWIPFSNVSKLIYVLGGTFIFGRLITLLLGFIQPNEFPSFILLTKESYLDKIRVLDKHKALKLKYIGTIILSLIVSIIANYLYTYLTSRS